MNVTFYGYDINLEIVAFCVILYFIIVFNMLYSTVSLKGLKDLYELIGISVNEGFEVLKETTEKLKQLKEEKNKPEKFTQKQSQTPTTNPRQKF
jgi:hypothetical protein